jgi:hypothetical protein
LEKSLDDSEKRLAKSGHLGGKDVYVLNLESPGSSNGKDNLGTDLKGRASKNRCRPKGHFTVRNTLLRS